MLVEKIVGKSWASYCVSQDLLCQEGVCLEMLRQYTSWVRGNLGKVGRRKRKSDWMSELREKRVGRGMRHAVAQEGKLMRYSEESDGRHGEASRCLTRVSTYISQLPDTASAVVQLVASLFQPNEYLARCKSEPSSTSRVSNHSLTQETLF